VTAPFEAKDAFRTHSVLHNLKPRFLEGLTSYGLKSVLAAAKSRKIPPNSVIANQENPATHLFLLLTGRARYFFMTGNGQKVILLWISPGEIVGMAALLEPPTEYLVSAETVREGSMLVWDRATIRSLTRRYPTLYKNALSEAHRYLIAYQAAHMALICSTAQERLARVLVSLASGIGCRVPDGIELNVGNEELANEANVTQSTASRLLSEWQRGGILFKSRGKILLHSPERLL
jgi:CRP-like cAMP-binding protein